MKIYIEQPLRDFDFWNGAKSRVKVLTSEELDLLEGCIEELWPYGCSDTEINDLFWFDEDLIAEWLGFESFEALEESRIGNA